MKGTLVKEKSLNFISNYIFLTRCFKYNSVEEIIKALTKDASKFALDCVKSMLRGSPTSLKVMLECFRRAEHLSYNECIRMEYRLWQRMPVSFLYFLRWISKIKKLTFSCIVYSRLERRYGWTCSW